MRLIELELLLSASVLCNPVIVIIGLLLVGTMTPIQLLLV